MINPRISAVCQISNMDRAAAALSAAILLFVASCNDEPATSPVSAPEIRPEFASSSAPATLLAAGDIAECNHWYDEATARLLDKMSGTIAALGDNVYSRATSWAFKNCYGRGWGRHKARTRPAPGNHDYNSPNAGPYYRYFGSRAGPYGRGYYSYNLGAWHIVSLNSERLSRAQEWWLKNDLARHRNRCVLAYWHHPLFTSGKHEPAKRMRQLFRILYDAGADVVLSAHNHQYERFAPQDPYGRTNYRKGIRQFVVGTGGHPSRYPFVRRAPNSQKRYNGGHGVLKLTLNPGSYAWRFVSVPGKSFTDSGSGQCH
jgi:acid phosphatase type 7